MLTKNWQYMNRSIIWLNIWTEIRLIQLTEKNKIWCYSLQWKIMLLQFMTWNFNLSNRHPNKCPSSLVCVCVCAHAQLFQGKATSAISLLCGWLRSINGQSHGWEKEFCYTEISSWSCWQTGTTNQPIKKSEHTLTKCERCITNFIIKVLLNRPKWQ